MKKSVSLLQFFLASLFISLSGFSCEKPNISNSNTPSAAMINLLAQINSMPKDSLSVREKENLVWMREEEKLARDVYMTLNETWNSQVFSNISSSEQQHMDAVLALLNKYNIPDPASQARGVFHDPALQQLYNTLVASGRTSLFKAFEAGANIEDLDLKDLQRVVSETDNADILLVYGSLQKGSRNHMRAFYRNLQKQGITYIPQYITQDELNAIISSPMERGYQQQ